MLVSHPSHFLNTELKIWAFTHALKDTAITIKRKLVVTSTFPWAKRRRYGQTAIIKVSTDCGSFAIVSLSAFCIALLYPFTKIACMGNIHIIVITATRSAPNVKNCISVRTGDVILPQIHRSTSRTSETVSPVAQSAVLCLKLLLNSLKNERTAGTYSRRTIFIVTA